MNPIACAPHASAPAHAPALPAVSQLEIAEIARVEITVEPCSWHFAVTRREEVDRHFARLKRQRPAIWNGRVLLLNRYETRDGMLCGTCFETDYASFVAWRDWNCPDHKVLNVFAAAALQAGDGSYLLGEMAPDTANAGAIYFPCGTPEPEDISAGALDLAANVRRELAEETGLDLGLLQAEPGWTMVRDGGLLGLIQRVTSPQSAPELRGRIMRHLAAQRHAEFSTIHIVRGPADLRPRMPRFIVAYLEAMWRR
jgi:hypothetical protein